MDLENNDERQLAEMLVRLAFVEPGENWKEATYKGSAGIEAATDHATGYT